jgi:imidazolonepropionase
VSLFILGLGERKKVKVRAYIHASEILTGQGIRKKKGRRVQEEDMGRIQDGALVYSLKKSHGIDVPDRILWVGATEDLPRKWKKVPTLDLKGRRGITPGLVDCHTHLIFDGNRAEEFAKRCAGVSYQEIAAQGGGIQATVRATRLASESRLLKLASERVKEMIRHGVRSIEVKSGYGLSLESELKLLRVIPKLQKKFPQLTFVSTFLGAHDFPKDQSREDYLKILISEMLPKIATEGLAQSCDVFIDEGYYTREEGQFILSQAQRLGLKVRVHADELSDTGSAELAAQLKALSADHLLKISDSGIQALARSETVAVLLPGTAFYLKAEYAPARKLIEAGAQVALATDYNPGTCVCLSLPLMMTLAALYLKMSRAEIFAAVTFNAAQALDLHHRKGALAEGLDADFWVMPFSTFEEAYYRFGW